MLLHYLTLFFTYNIGCTAYQQTINEDTIKERKSPCFVDPTANFTKQLKTLVRQHKAVTLSNNLRLAV